MSLDEARAAFPHLGLAVYAYDPGGPVTVEVHANGETWTFEAPTFAAAMDRAFPSLARPPEPEPEPEPAPTTPQPNVFD